MTPEHELESEDDEAPEEVTFHNAKSQAEESSRMRSEVAKKEKAALKERRKRKQELFSEQKKKKLLSDDILQTVTALPDKKDESSKHSDETNEKGDAEKERSDKGKRAKKIRPRKRLDKNYKVVPLNNLSLGESQQHRAREFLQNSLYGKNKNRTTANEFLSIERKRGSKKLPSFQFTDQSWGEKEKKRAKKFNLLWRHKQKL